MRGPRPRSRPAPHRRWRGSARMSWRLRPRPSLFRWRRRARRRNLRAGSRRSTSPARGTRRTRATDVLAAGSTLCDGRYRLEEVVGRGGMAAVWRATDLQLERPVAIKVISDVLAGDPRFVARFEREARLAAGLNHPNLVKLFDYSVDDERPLLVMEYVPGGTLVNARDRVDPLPLARELLDALAHIHGAGILHRDVKPANVLVGPDGSPRLTDFGIARSDDNTALTLTGQVMGTLRYIAPEVAEGLPATARSDLYSLGVLLSEVAGPDAPAPLGGLLLRMTAPDPAQR